MEETVREVSDFLARHGFRTDRPWLADVAAAFAREIEAKFAGEASSLQMLPSGIPDDFEVRRGVPCVVLDAGGTNLRAASVTFPEDGSAPVFAHFAKAPMPGTDGPVTAERFHARIAALADPVFAAEPAADALGYCFSYVCRSLPDHDAELLAWSKQIDAPEVVGQRVGAELAKRLTRRPARLTVLNDTVATLLAGKALEGGRRYGAHLGVILGTGTNVACVHDGLVYNAESGEFDKLARSEFDRTLDAKTSDPGAAVFEKMVSGAYLGPLAREIFATAAKEGLIGGASAAALDAIETPALDALAAGTTGVPPVGSPNAPGAAASSPPRSMMSVPMPSVRSQLSRGRGRPRPDDASIVRSLARAVFTRAAVLCGAHLAAFLHHVRGAAQDAPVLVTVDGSTYWKTRSVPFDALVRETIGAKLLSDLPAYEIVRLDEAPMVGAAVAASLA